MQRFWRKEDQWQNVLQMIRSALFTMIAIASLMATCSKSSNRDENGNGLVGKWKKTEFLVSPGPIGSWQPYTGEPWYLQFHGNGRFEYTSTFLWKDYSLYKVTSDSTLSVYTTLYSDSARLYYKIDSGKLTLWLPCIEPCGILLEKTDATNP